MYKEGNQGQLFQLHYLHIKSTTKFMINKLINIGVKTKIICRNTMNRLIKVFKSSKDQEHQIPLQFKEIMCNQ